MFQSSADYIKALRDGRYLQFLNWPNFIRDFYQSKSKALDADEVNDLLFYEWVSNGFTKDDAKCFALLCALNDQYPKLILGKQSYAFVSIYGALIQCMVYAEINGLNVIPKHEPGSNNILDWVKSNALLMSQSDYQESINRQQLMLEQLIKEVSGSQLIEIHRQVTPVLNMHSTLDEYLNILEKRSSNQETMLVDRVGFVKGLIHYVETISSLNQEASDKIQKYVDRIRAHRPEKWEDEYLNTISPPSIFESSFKSFINLGLTLFKYIEDNSSKPNQKAPLKK